MGRKFFLLAVTALLAVAGQGFAQFPTFHVRLEEPSLTLPPNGGTVTFRAFFKNNGPNPVYINGATITLVHPGGFTLDDTKFYLNAPTVLAGGATTAGFIDVFDVSATAGIPELTSAAGIFTVVGGTTQNSFQDIGGDHFLVTVVPEGSSLALFGVGIVALGVFLRRRPQLLTRIG